MSKLHFNDGVTIDTSGPYRVIRLSDGCYVVGHGMCCPVSSFGEGMELIKQLTTIKGARNEPE
jgi:hypothetical protein